jgi:hypothetical protein
VIGIEVVNAEGRLIIQTVWATTADRRAGPRATRRVESVAGAEELMARLAELVPAIAWRPELVPLLA